MKNLKKMSHDSLELIFQVTLEHDLFGRHPRKQVEWNW